MNEWEVSENRGVEATRSDGVVVIRVRYECGLILGLFGIGEKYRVWSHADTVGMIFKDGPHKELECPGEVSYFKKYGQTVGEFNTVKNAIAAADKYWPLGSVKNSDKTR